jgi:hypothetical protein
MRLATIWNGHKPYHLNNQPLPLLLEISSLLLFWRREPSIKPDDAGAQTASTAPTPIRRCAHGTGKVKKLCAGMTESDREKIQLVQQYRSEAFNASKFVTRNFGYSKFRITFRLYMTFCQPE